MTEDDRQGGPEEPETRQAQRAAIRATWWPPVHDAASAMRVARYGFWAAVINIGLTGLFLFLLADQGRAGNVLATDALVWWAIADIAVFVAVGVGLYFYSRIAALAGLVLYVASKLYAWTLAGDETNYTTLLISALFAYFFVLGVRGTFALRRFRPGGGA